MLIVMLLNVSPLFSQTDTLQIPTNNSISDTVVYTPIGLMELLMRDLEQCDIDRIELKKTKAELTLVYLDLAKKENTVTQLKRELKEVREYNDTLVANNLQMTLDNGKELKKVRRSKRFWTTTTFVGFLTAVGVHLNWKNSYIEW
jgi:hypothetical protein